MGDRVLPGWVSTLSESLTARLGAEVVVDAVRPLAGGACQENFRVDLTVGGEPRTLALRSDAKVSLPGSLDRAHEFQVIAAAVDQGVPTPAVHWLLPDLLREGASAYLMDWVEGQAIGRRVLRDKNLAEARKVLVDQLASALAEIHRITPESHPDLSLRTPQSAGERTPVDAAMYFCREMLDKLPEPHPAMELTLSWLAANTPGEREITLVHGDFRTGNFMVGPAGLNAVLDWEFSHWGVPACDLAWISVRDWRFGRLDRPVGGFAKRADFYRAYQRLSGRSIDLVEVHWWEIMGNLRWGAGAVYQAERVLSGGEFDLELLAIGRRAAEMEHEMLRLIAIGPQEIS